MGRLSSAVAVLIAGRQLRAALSTTLMKEALRAQRATLVGQAEPFLDPVERPTFQALSSPVIPRSQVRR